MDVETMWQGIASERRSLADLLDSLTTEQWEQRSLCAGWRVRDVAAHVAMVPSAPSVLGMLRPALRARGNFNRLNSDLAVRYATRPTADIVDTLRATADSRLLPSVTSVQNLSFDILVHGQDIAVPLGLTKPVPADAAAAGVERVWRMGWPFWARRRLRDFRITATDVQWERGQGPEIRGPVDAILLLLTGRDIALTRLTGAGSDMLRRNSPLTG